MLQQAHKGVSVCGSAHYVQAAEVDGQPGAHKETLLLLLLLICLPLGDDAHLCGWLIAASNTAVAVTRCTMLIHVM
jgi:hypothetical protein